MKNDNKMAEEALLSSTSLDELIKMRMKEEVKKAFFQPEKATLKIRVEDIKKAPKEKLFSKNAVYKIFNKANNSTSFINGIQAEALLGLQTSVREKLLLGEIEVFTTDNAFVKFEYVDIIN